MAPKRKAVGVEQPPAGQQPQSTQAAAQGSAQASGTLAGASGQSVDTLLDRVGNRRLRALAAKGVKASSAFPLPKPRAVADAVCGAPAQAQAAVEEQKLAQKEEDEGLASASDWEWEDAAEGEEDWEAAEAKAPINGFGAVGSFDIDASEEAGPSRPRRKGITKEEREMARLLHRTHLLCLLSRGLLFDQAASDPLLQATMLSMADPNILPAVDKAKGLTATALQPLLSWFNCIFRQLQGPGQEGPADDDDLAAAANGLDSVTAQLQDAAGARQGTAEQLSALFVALCRAQGLLVRSVRVLDPMPLNPGARKVGSAHLKQPRRPKPKQAAAAAAGGSANAVSTGVAGDKSGKTGRGRKRKSAESIESHEAPDLCNDASQLSKAAASKSSRGKGRKAAAVNTESVEDGAASPSSGRKAQQPNQGHAAGKSGKGKGKRGKQKAQQEPDPQLEDDMAAACAASLEHAREHSSGSPLPQQAKRVGDLELENQLAMAMASTAAEAQHKVHRKLSVSAVHDEPMPSTLSPKAGVARPTLGETWARDARVPKQDFAQSDAASHWAEVFCGSAELGKWTHADPLLNWLDVPDKVEGAGIRFRGLAYVVAFANRGAKDVTQRYVGSVLAADKLRDNSWWEQTLRPLRKHEVAATTLHHKALQLKSPSVPDGSAPDQTQHQPHGETETQRQAPAALSHQAASSSPHGLDRTSKMVARATELALKREDAEFSHKAGSERRNLPSNVEGFKNHPVYVLERHIGRYFALKPGTKKAGMHRGEGYYPREALAELHTADRWLRDGLEVRPEEVGKPYKVVKRRGVKDAPGPSSNPSQAEPQEEEEVQEEASVIPVPDAMVTKMYGRWQTQQWEVPTAVGGLVPKNDRGNVHCPPLASELPKGTVHLQMPRLGPICKKLGVDYAPAMTGFDIRGGRSVPTIEGVVICKEDEATVLEAYLEEEQLREKQAAERRRQEADSAWRQLLRSMWTRLRLHQDYGDNAAAHAGQDHTDLAEAAFLREDLSGAAEVVDLSQEQHHAAGPSGTAALHNSAPGAAARDAASHSPDADAKSETKDVEPHVKPSSKKRSARAPRGRQKESQGVAASENAEAGGGLQVGSTFQRRSKSGVEVEMEEI